MKILLLAPIVLAVSLARLASPAVPAEEPTTLQVDTTHSSAIFRIQHAGCSWFYGRFDQTSGSIRFDREHPENGSVEIAIATNSVHTGAEGRNGHLMRSDFFDASQFPAITFKSTKIARGETKDIYDVTGELELRGVTKSITIPVEFTGEGEFRGSKRYGFASTFTIKRSDFGMSYGVGTVLGDEVQLTMGLEAVATGD